MASDTESDSGWQVVEKGRPVTLAVQLRQKVYILPWSLFLYAEGTAEEVKLQFHTHVVTVQGAGLGSLLSVISAQLVCALREPDRMAKFTAVAGPHLTAVTVSENK
jgi:hypothetical protein